MDLLFGAAEPITSEEQVLHNGAGPQEVIEWISESNKAFISKVVNMLDLGNKLFSEHDELKKRVG